MIETATELLDAFAGSDTAAIRRLCTDDVVVWGTDVGEEWAGKAELLRAFEGTYDLEAAWADEPLVEGPLVAGRVTFTFKGGATVTARVTMVFRDDSLVHAHYSIPAPQA